MMSENRPNNKTNRTVWLTIRLSPDDKAELERLAGGQPVGQYVRTSLLAANDNDPLPTSVKRRRKSKEALKAHAQILAKLGQSDAAFALREMARLAKLGALPLSDETEAAIQKGCEDIADIKTLLMRELGVRET